MRATILTKGIVLKRTDYQEADRILTILTPDHGKLHVIAKGVRKPKSKLAGGIELFSVSQLSVLPGRGELSTLVSTRLDSHFGNIVGDISRTMYAYEILKNIDRATEDTAEEGYFDIIRGTLEGLNDSSLEIDKIKLWFSVQLLKISGSMPNLLNDAKGNRLDREESYAFDYDHMAFKRQSEGIFTSNHIKLLRLAYGSSSPLVLKQVTDAEKPASELYKIMQNVVREHIRIE